MPEPKDNSGVLFRNDKGDNPKRPDYRGSALIGGTEYWISGWVNTPKEGGDKYLSLKATTMDEQSPGSRDGVDKPAPDDSQMPF